MKASSTTTGAVTVKRNTQGKTPSVIANFAGKGFRFYCSAETESLTVSGLTAAEERVVAAFVRAWPGETTSKDRLDRIETLAASTESFADFLALARVVPTRVRTIPVTVTAPGSATSRTYLVQVADCARSEEIATVRAVRLAVTHTGHRGRRADETLGRYIGRFTATLAPVLVPRVDFAVAA